MFSIKQQLLLPSCHHCCYGAFVCLPTWDGYFTIFFLLPWLLRRLLVNCLNLIALVCNRHFFLPTLHMVDSARSPKQSRVSGNRFDCETKRKRRASEIQLMAPSVADQKGGKLASTGEMTSSKSTEYVHSSSVCNGEYSNFSVPSKCFLWSTCNMSGVYEFQMKKLLLS